MSKWLDSINWDRLGIGLSFLCAIHCLITPFVLISLPILARYYLVHPLFHLILALIIIPVGLLAFISGYRHHKIPWALVLGVPGLFIVAGVPYLAHVLLLNINETALMVLGSALLISGHLINRQACRSCEHHGPAGHLDHTDHHSAMRDTELDAVTVSTTEVSQ